MDLIMQMKTILLILNMTLFYKKIKLINILLTFLNETIRMIICCDRSQFQDVYSRQTDKEKNNNNNKYTEKWQIQKKKSYDYIHVFHQLFISLISPFHHCSTIIIT